jgi:hypothetical protein
MNTLELTVAEFREINGLKSQVEANSVMNFLKTKGLAVVVGKRKTASGKGKPSTIFEIPQDVTLSLFSDEDIDNIPTATSATSATGNPAVTYVKTTTVLSETDENTNTSEIVAIDEDLEFEDLSTD